MPDQRLQRPLDSLHRRLWAARTRRGLSRATASVLLGMSSKHLQRIENAEREPTVAQVAAAATAYGVDARWLLLGEAGPGACGAAEPHEPAVALAELLHRCAQPQATGGGAAAELARDVGILTLALRRRRDAEPAPAGRWCQPEPAGAGRCDRDKADFNLSRRPEEALRERHAAFRLAFDWYLRTGGAAAADEAAFQRLLPWLQILVPKPDGSPYLWCGQLTPPAAIWGEAVALDLVGKRVLPDAAIDRAVNGEYLEVRRLGRPIAQAVRGPVTLDGRTHLVQWHRWIVPLRFLGYPAIATLAILDHDRRQEI